MTEILMRQGSFLTWGLYSTIDVAILLLDQYFGGFGIHRRLNGEIVGFLEHVVQLEVVDWLWRGAVLDGH